MRKPLPWGFVEINYLMIEEAKITFYRVSRCGYYKGFQSTPEFGGMGDTLEQFMGWAKAEGRALSDTCTYEIEDNSDCLKTYCLNLSKQPANADFLLTTWNATPINSGRVASVQGNKRVGEAGVIFDKVPNGAIPGYATYFWFIPEKKLLATVRFQHVLNGSEGMTRLLHEYMAKFTSYVVRAENPDVGVDVQVLGYAGTPEAPHEPLFPRFKTELFRKQAAVDLIIASYSSVRKIIRKNLLVSAEKNDFELWQKLLCNMGITDPHKPEHMSIKFEIPYKPTKVEMKAIVAEWTANHESKWDDVGFKMTGRDDPVWLSHSIAKSTFKIDVKRDNDEVVNSESLLSELAKIRDAAISLTVYK